MTVRVNLPPGCYGLKADDGTPYNDKPGGKVVIEDHHAKQIMKGRNGQLGIITDRQPVSIGTRRGQRCIRCGFLAQGWATQCPRCGGETEEE